MGSGLELLVLYTLLVSLPLLVVVFVLFVYKSLVSLCLFLSCGNNSLVGGLCYGGTVFAFLVKIRTFMVL